jgi:RNase P/RNase MRP subunit POP5
VQSQTAASAPTCTRFDHKNSRSKMYRNSRTIDQHTGSNLRASNATKNSYRFLCVLRMSSRSILKNELNRAILKRVAAAAGSVRISCCRLPPVASVTSVTGKLLTVMELLATLRQTAKSIWASLYGDRNGLIVAQKFVLRASCAERIPYFSARGRAEASDVVRARRYLG